MRCKAQGGGMTSSLATSSAERSPARFRAGWSMGRVKLRSSLTHGLACLWGLKIPPLTTGGEKTIVHVGQKHHEQGRYIMFSLCPQETTRASPPHPGLNTTSRGGGAWHDVVRLGQRLSSLPSPRVHPRPGTALLGKHRYGENQSTSVGNLGNFLELEASREAAAMPEWRVKGT